MPLNTRVQFEVDAELTASFDLASGSVPLALRRQFIWATGTAASQADKIWHDQRTLTASATEDLDLAGGSLTDTFGGALTFARVRGLIIYAATANTNNVVVGGDANALALFGAATHTLPVRPGGLLVLLAPDTTGYVVTAGTGDILQFANSGGGTSVVYDVVIVGASA